MDNSTAVAYITSMGGTKSTYANKLAKKIWYWCIDNRVHISAAHIPGATNIEEADKESRVFNDNTKWMLRSDIFKTIVRKLGLPDIDLFASGFNRQVSCYVSCKPDPEAAYTDAYSVDLSKYFIYAFPPFSLVVQCLHKVELHQTEGIIVVPNWATQAWFSRLMQLLTANLLALPKTRTTLQLPWEFSKLHPLYKNQTLLACRISSKLTKHKGYLKQQQTLLSAPRDPVLENDIKATL